jgi:hypothetical protein
MVAMDVMKKYAPRTQEAKVAAMRMFMAFLSATGRRKIYFPEQEEWQGGTWIAPSHAAEEQTLVEFAVMRVMAGVAPDTAGGTVSNVRTWCELMLDRKYGKVGNKNKASLTSNYIQAMKKSAYYPETDSDDHRRAPITWEMVKMFVRAAESEGRRDVGVVLAVAFAGLFRMGELTSTNAKPFSPRLDLTERDVEFSPSFWAATHIMIHIGRSKADQDGKKALLRPRTLPMDKGSPAFLLRDMLARRHGVRQGQTPVLTTTPLFQNTQRGHLTRDGVMRFLRKVLKEAGWSDRKCKQYGTHSCRIGGCTALFQLGASAEVIKNMGGWSSDAYKVYIRLQQQHLMDFSRKMCVPSQSAMRSIGACPLLHTGGRAGGQHQQA